MQLVNFLLRDFLEDSNREQVKNASEHVVKELLGDMPVTEASVHRSKRSKVWNAVFSAPAGGQTSRTTGLINRDQALLVAKRWEAEARAQRTKLGGTAKRTILRVRRSANSTGFGPLTQKEVGMLLNLSERSVREIERRAFRKIRDHPLMRGIWQDYLSGELDEHQPTLSQEEIEALFHVARTPEERHLLQKVLRLIGGL
jgi:DNA-directed RNA polymerase sigma subunit (sigma70/sigma32)